MSWENLTTIIVSLLALAGVVITNWGSNRKAASEAATRQAVTDTKIEQLTLEVRKHNDFASRVPVLEEQMKVANHRITDLEKHAE